MGCLRADSCSSTDSYNSHDHSHYFGPRTGRRRPRRSARHWWWSRPRARHGVSARLRPALGTRHLLVHFASPDWPWSFTRVLEERPSRSACRHLLRRWVFAWWVCRWANRRADVFAPPARDLWLLPDPFGHSFMEENAIVIQRYPVHRGSQDQ